MRHLYTTKDEPNVRNAIAVAQKLERRRCGHHPDDYPDPLPTEACIASVVDPKDNGTNKHCYVVASQSLDLRKAMRGVRGVPLVYVKRAVMVMEPMADESVQARAIEEKLKFRSGLRSKAGDKRKRDEDEDEDQEEGEGKPEERIGGDGVDDGGGEAPEPPAKRKKKYGVKKGPNPLSVKKKARGPAETPKKHKKPAAPPAEAVEPSEPVKKKRKRAKKKTQAADEGGAEATAATAVADSP